MEFSYSEAREWTFIMFGKSLHKHEANIKQKSDENKDKYQLGGN